MHGLNILIARPYKKPYLFFSLSPSYHLTEKIRYCLPKALLCVALPFLPLCRYIIKRDKACSNVCFDTKIVRMLAFSREATIQSIEYIVKKGLFPPVLAF